MSKNCKVVIVTYTNKTYFRICFWVDIIFYKNYDNVLKTVWLGSISNMNKKLSSKMIKKLLNKYQRLRYDNKQFSMSHKQDNSLTEILKQSYYKQDKFINNILYYEYK